MSKWNPEKLKNHKGMSGKIGFWAGKKRKESEINNGKFKEKLCQQI